MGIHENLKKFCGKTVANFEVGARLGKRRVAWRVSSDSDGDDTTWDEIWGAFLRDPDVERVEELLIGVWDYEAVIDEQSRGAPVQSLAIACKKLPNLKALFLGEMTRSECEISWIRQSDISPLLKAFPRLETFYVRGGAGLEITKPVHDRLKTLVVQTGGLSKKFLKQLAKARFPSLEHLELWLGTDEYGGDVAPKDLKPILEGDLFPNLAYLGLCNSDRANQIAAIVSEAPILEQLETLDLSKGNMTDAGAEALLESPLAARLKRLDLSHHYLSPECAARFKKAKIRAVVADRQEEYDFGDGEIFRHIYCSE